MTEEVLVEFYQQGQMVARLPAIMEPGEPPVLRMTDPERMPYRWTELKLCKQGKRIPLGAAEVRAA